MKQPPLADGGPQDCIVIGGGPAGLTAALYLARFLRSVILFDTADGRAAMIASTQNLAPFPEGIPGPDLLERMRDNARRYGVSFVPEKVTSVETLSDGIRVTTESHRQDARFLVLATGVNNHRPPLSDSDHDAGLLHGLIRYCPVCDAFEVRGKRIAVLGSGEHGMREAHFLRHYSNSVTLIPPAGTSAAAEDGIAVPGSSMADLAISDDEVLVTLASGKLLRFDTLYVALGTTPRSDLAAALGAELLQGGHVRVDAHQRTNLDRVYAIGDVTDGLDQIGVAMGQAAVVATAIHNELA